MFSDVAAKNLYRLISRYIYHFVPVALAFLTSINTVTNRFAYDDIWMFVKNSFIHNSRNLPLVLVTNPWTPTDVPGLVFPYFRPLIAGLHMIEWRLFGKTAALYHLVNVAVHSLAVFLVFIFLKKISNRPRLAFVAAALFAVHPVHAEPVAWISGVPELLIAVFGLLILHLYVSYRREQRGSYLWLMSALFAFAVFCKENAFFLLPAILLLEIYLSEKIRLPKRSFVRVLTVWGAFALPTLVYLALRFYANGGMVVSSERHYSLSVVVLTIPEVILKYIELLIIPAGYSIHHPVDVVTAFSLADFLAPLVAIVAGIWAIAYFGSRLLIFSAAWFALWLAPALVMLGTFVSPVYFVQDRYLYLPSIGFCLAAAIGIDRLFEFFAESFWKLRAVQLGFVVLIGVLASVHARQNLVWHDNFSLFKHNVYVNSSQPEAYNSLSLEYIKISQLSQARELMEIARNLDPYNIRAYTGSAQVAKKSGDTDQALRFLHQAENISDKRYNIKRDVYYLYILLGRYYAEQNETDKAEKYFNKALANGVNIYTLDELGKFYYEQGRYEEALQIYNQARGLAPPGSGYVLLQLGLIYQRLEQPKKARREYEAYLRLLPAGRHHRMIRTQLRLIGLQETMRP